MPGGELIGLWVVAFLALTMGAAALVLGCTAAIRCDDMRTGTIEAVKDFITFTNDQFREIDETFTKQADRIEQAEAQLIGSKYSKPTEPETSDTSFLQAVANNFKPLLAAINDPRPLKPRDEEDEYQRFMANLKNEKFRSVFDPAEAPGPESNP